MSDLTKEALINNLRSTLLHIKSMEEAQFLLNEMANHKPSQNEVFISPYLGFQVPLLICYLLTALWLAYLPLFVSASLPLGSINSYYYILFYLSVSTCIAIPLLLLKFRSYTIQTRDEKQYYQSRQEKIERYESRLEQDIQFLYNNSLVLDTYWDFEALRACIRYLEADLGTSFDDTTKQLENARMYLESRYEDSLRNEEF